MLNVVAKEIGKVFGMKKRPNRIKRNNEYETIEKKEAWKGVNIDLLSELEKVIQKEVKDIQELQNKSVENKTEKIKTKMDGLNFIMDRYNKMIEMEIEKKDKEERVRVDEQKITTNERVERRKQKLSVEKVVLTSIEVLLPILAYNAFQLRLLKFEETGKLLTSASRMLQLPRLW